LGSVALLCSAFLCLGRIGYKRDFLVQILLTLLANNLSFNKVFLWFLKGFLMGGKMPLDC